ncbi:pancreatic triacylglycerol lipase-like [Contarinia nasturtii]|uniref:pancreatic triacylglycerol lipase-like n=1 Tax=Contarinia nasturtii TaxID=265458 RepID=UPI0012D4C317|nr:pancreatic triacylglycerol lipase-like [Contarinia nasturtii]
MKLIKWTIFVVLLQTFRLAAGIFLFPHKKYVVSRQDTECERETVTFNSSFIEFMLAFLGVDQSECACDDPCPSVAKFVKLYIYRTDTNSFHRLFANGSNAHLIDHTRPTTVFVHGFSDSFHPRKNSWNNQLSRMESRILNRNTLALDWGDLSRCPYRQATESLVPEVGNLLYRILNDVLKLDLRTVNCVGHSLGGHICGYAGAASSGQFERCFGLDPAGLYYTVDYDGPSRGLNKTCCQYVQAIHTDMAIGSRQAMGHIDFFPNNQTGTQPHCLIQATGCSHIAVVEYYKAALDPNNKFIGVACGKHSNPSATCRFGAHTTTDCESGSFCFDTAPCAPYTYSSR